MMLVPPAENLPAFYTDKSPVTFHHFVEFLNAVIDRVRVDNGVVKHKEEIWAYLGDGSAPFEQILYEHGRFHLRDAAWAPRSVVRVTWLGAEAYARFYKKRLPSSLEWQRLMTILANDNKILLDNNAPSPSVGERMHMMPPSDSDKATTGVTSSDGRIPLVREWIAGEHSGSGATNNKEEDIISHVAEWPIYKKQNVLQRRYPWEGFSDVGFRTVIDAGIVRSEP
jgi:eukaryotic-like serine/threonine-protein kinase